MTGTARTAVGLLVAGVMSAGVLAGCAPEPAPSPAPTPTVTALTPEEEAFRAAEATYRAYVDAVNARRRDPNSTPSPESFLTGAALADEIAAHRLLRDMGLTVIGDSSVVKITRVGIRSSLPLIAVCMSAAGTMVLDSTGADVTPVDRVEVMAIDVGFATVGDDMIIASSTTGDARC